MKENLLRISLLLLAIISLSCSETERQRQRYFSNGMMLYKNYCSTCHGDDGTSNLMNIPPIKDSDFFLEDPHRTMCLVKYGSHAPMLVNGMPFHQHMPASPKLTPVDLAYLLTFLYNHWGDYKGIYTLEQVDSMLLGCSSYKEELMFD